MDYKKMKIDDIINWCVENNQIEWLKAISAETVEVKVYPKMKGVDGKPLRDVNGHFIFNRAAEPMIDVRPISFFQIKEAFVNKFMPEIKPEKKTPEKKGPNMFDRINAL